MPTDDTCTAVLLHGLGGSARTWDAVTEHLGASVRPLPIDLPGFGDESAAGAVDVSGTVDDVLRRIARDVVGPWLLVGHSMGGKIANVAARRVLVDGAPVFGLAGVVLLSASPLAPEPMSDDKRAEMLDWAANSALDEAAAAQYVADNVADPLPPTAHDRAVDDARRTSPEAWRAWLQRGSREDWSAIGDPLDVPAVILGGDDDPDLGAEAQLRLTAPGLPRAAVVTLAGTGHLLPLERPAEVAAAVTALWTDHAGRGPRVPDDMARVIASDRVSARTRAVLARRAVADDPGYRPRVLSGRQLAVLRVLADVVVPQDGPPSARVDLAARVDTTLATGRGDGWRPADLPPDVQAYRLALDQLDDLPELSPEQREKLVASLADGTGADGAAAGGVLDGAQLAAWFEDAVTDLVRQWVDHPATAARIGFDGFANGGDGPRKQGWLELRAGHREAWEPAMPVAGGGAR